MGRVPGHPPHHSLTREARLVVGDCRRHEHDGDDRENRESNVSGDLADNGPAAAALA